MEYYIFIAACILIFLIFSFLKVKLGKAKGKQGEKSVAKVLKKCKGKTINGICLPLYDSITELDHIFIGKMGIVIIETKNISGSVFGNKSDTNWVHKIGSKTHKLYNPLFQNKTHCDNVIHHLKKMGIDNIPVYSLVVFADKSISLNIPGKSNIIKISELNAYINSLPASKNNIHVKEIYRGLNSIAQKSLVKLYNHNKNIRRKK